MHCKCRWKLFFKSCQFPAKFFLYIFSIHTSSKIEYKITSIKSIENMQYKTIENRNGNLWISHIRMLHIQRNWKVIIFFVWLWIRDCILMPVSSIQKEIFVREKENMFLELRCIMEQKIEIGEMKYLKDMPLISNYMLYAMRRWTEMQILNINMNIETSWLLWIIRKHRHKQKKNCISIEKSIQTICYQIYNIKNMYGKTGIFFATKPFQ